MKPDVKPEVDSSLKGISKYGPLFKAEVAWAHDAIIRKDYKLATKRLYRVLKALNMEEGES